MPMNRHWICYLAVAVLVVLFLLGMAPGNYTVYLPLVYRQPTPTPTLLPGHYYLAGRVFFDYNGSGLQEQGEPGIQGVPVYVDNLGSALHATTAADGSYSIANVPLGEHQVYVQSPTQDPATAFRYINLFKGWVDIPAYEMNGVSVPAQHLPDTQIKPIGQSADATVTSTTTLDVALMQGFLTLPFQQGVPVYILGYHDIDGLQPWIKNGAQMNYFGLTYDWTATSTHPSPLDQVVDQESLYLAGVSGVNDFHAGIDLRLDSLSPVVAPIPGTVKRICTDCNGVHVWVEHQFGTDHFVTLFGHLDAILPVSVGMQVLRGQLIAFSSNTTSGNIYHYRGELRGYMEPLMHFGLAPDEDSSKDLDMFRNVSGFSSAVASPVSYWSADNEIFRPITGGDLSQVRFLQ